MTRLVIIGGSDAGITAGLRARQLDPTTEVHLVVADDYPNFSICGIPYYISGEVPDWHSMAHRSKKDLENAGLRLHLEERAIGIDVDARTLSTVSAAGEARAIGYDRLIIATGAVPNKPPIAGLDELGAGDGVHLLHTMGDTFAVTQTLEEGARSAVIVGAGYIGLEMAEALRNRGLDVTVVEQLGQVLPRTLDPQLATLIETELVRNGVSVYCDTSVTSIERSDAGLEVHVSSAGQPGSLAADLILVVTGVRPDTQLAVDAGAKTGFGGALAVDPGMRTNLPDVYAAGDCVHTHHRLLDDPAYVPLGTTAHKQGRVAGRTRSEAVRRTPGRWEPRSCGSSTWSLRRPDSATAKPQPPATTRPRSCQRPTTTRSTTQAPRRSHFISPVTQPPADCSEPSSSATHQHRLPSASTSSPQRSTTAAQSTTSASSTCPTPHRSARLTTPSRSLPRLGRTTSSRDGGGQSDGAVKVSWRRWNSKCWVGKR